MKESKMKLTNFLQKSFSLFPLLFAITLALAAAYRPLSLKSDILKDYSPITQDGLQWIMQGRTFAKLHFTESWPELRNPGYVLISSLDGLLGGQGIVFSISIAFALLVQIFVIFKISHRLTGSNFLSGSFASAFILNPINFISLHILSDAFSVALMFLLIYSAFLILYEEKKVNIFYLGLLGLISALFQLYTLYPIIILIVFLALRARDSNINRNYQIKVITYLLMGALTGFLLRQLWYELITHNSSPNQLALISINFNNLNFYLNTWGWLLAPVLISSTIYLIITKKSNLNLNSFTLYIFTLTLLYALSIFFYNWQESRFSYFLVGIFYICLAILVESEKRKWLTNLLAFMVISLALIFGSIFTPTNKWAPQIGESVLFRPWILHGFWGSPPYAEYVATKNKYCKAGVVTIEVDEEILRTEMPLIANSDPEMGRFAIKNCL